MVCIISIHALREEGDSSDPRQQKAAGLFLSTPSARRATPSPFALCSLCRNFYPRPPRGGRRFSASCSFRQSNFYPRPPRGGRPSAAETAYDAEDISIHALREEGDAVLACSCTSCGVFLSTPSARRATRHQIGPRRSRYISIHALREEGDSAATGAVGCWVNFYPRPPRGGRPSTASAALPPTNFYPRPPRGGRPLTVLFVPTHTHFYPRPPRGGRPSRVRVSRCRAKISIHALREEGDYLLHQVRQIGQDFYPRPPRGGRREHVAHGLASVGISIHALREEGDSRCAGCCCPGCDFYPRPPRGGRRPRGRQSSPARQFLSTPSARRATILLSNDQAKEYDFYPRPPRGGRQLLQVVWLPSVQFLSTPSARRATRTERQQRWWTQYFYPRPPRGGRRPSLIVPSRYFLYFYPRPPRGGRP